MNKRFLAIVDDDPTVVASLEELLESAGYAARSFVSAEALLAHGLEDVEILITDIGMPGIDGFELRQRVWEEHPEIPVFLITGRHETLDQEQSRGPGGFLRKPFDGNALVAAVRDVLGGR